jgi:hypothetical protein
MNQYVIIGMGLAALLGFGVFLVWRAFRSERKRGVAEAQRDQFRKKSEQARRGNEIDENVARLSDDDLDSELCHRD